MKRGDCCRVTLYVVLQVPQNKHPSCLIALIEIIVDRRELSRRGKFLLDF